MSLAGNTLLGASFLLFLSSSKSVVRSPSSAAEDRTVEASLISSTLVSRSFVIVLRYYSSEHSLKHRPTTDVYPQDIKWSFQTGHSHSSGDLFPAQWTPGPDWSPQCRTLPGMPGYSLYRTPEFSLQWPWKCKSPLSWYTANRNLRKQPELFTIKTVISDFSTDNARDDTKQQQQNG